MQIHLFLRLALLTLSSVLLAPLSLAGEDTEKAISTILEKMSMEEKVQARLTQKLLGETHAQESGVATSTAYPATAFPTLPTALRRRCSSRFQRVLGSPLPDSQPNSPLRKIAQDSDDHLLFAGKVRFPIVF